MPTMHMLIGVPGSGKSFWLAQNVTPGAVVLSTDDLIDRWAQANNQTYTEIFKKVVGEATRVMGEQLRQAVLDKKDIFWDQTNSSTKVRASKLAQIPDTYEKVAVFFSTPPDAELVRRLASRPGKTIPTNVVLSMKSQLEPPTEAEGFDQIVTVF
jgi:predicted kinase